MQVKSKSQSPSEVIVPSLLSLAGQYSCTCCDKKPWKRRTDWMNHEQEHHRQASWPCNHCGLVSSSDRAFKKHHVEGHGCVKCDHAKEVIVIKQVKRSFGCGFCSGHLDDLDDRNNHIATHYEEGIVKQSWDHSKMIRGLLRAPEIASAWALILKERAKPSDFAAGLLWKKDESSSIVEKLEYQNYETTIAELLNRLYDLGKPIPPSKDLANSMPRSSNVSLSSISSAVRVTHPASSLAEPSIRHENFTPNHVTSQYTPANTSLQTVPMDTAVPGPTAARNELQAQKDREEPATQSASQTSRYSLRQEEGKETQNHNPMYSTVPMVPLQLLPDFSPEIGSWWDASFEDSLREWGAPLSLAPQFPPQNIYTPSEGVSPMSNVNPEHDLDATEQALESLMTDADYYSDSPGGHEHRPNQSILGTLATRYSVDMQIDPT
jgi:hypothetical protein